MIGLICMFYVTLPKSLLILWMAYIKYNSVILARFMYIFFGNFVVPKPHMYSSPFNNPIY